MSESSLEMVQDGVATANYERMSLLLNELSLYIMFALGFVLLRYLAQLIFALLSGLMMERLIDPRHSKLKKPEDYTPLEDTGIPAGLKQSLKSFLRERGYQNFAEMAKSYNAYLKCQGLKSEANPFRLLEEMKAQDISPDIVTYNILLDLCFKECRTDLALELFHHIKGDFDVRPDIVTYNICLKGMQIRHCLGDPSITSMAIAELLNDMRSHDLTANAITYNTIIDLCATLKLANEAWSYFEEMKAKGISPDMYTYSTLVKTLKQTSRVAGQASVGVFRQILKQIMECMSAQAGQLDEVLFNSLLDTAAHYKDFEAVTQTLAMMQAAHVPLSTVTYGILIRAYAQSERLEVAVSLFNEMATKHVPRNEVTYGSIIDACVSASRFAEAERYYHQMAEEHIPNNIVILTTLLKGYTMQQDLPHILELYERVALKRELSPNIIFYNALLEGLVRCEHFDLLLPVYEQLKRERDTALKPDVITYSTLIKGLSKARRMDHVLGIYAQLQRDGINVEVSVDNTVFNGLVMAQRYAEAERFYESMRLRKVQFNHYTYSIAAKLYKFSHEPAKALALLQTMKQDNVSPGLVCYTSLVQCCLKAKWTDKAIELFEQLKREIPKEIDQVMYNTIINGCIYAGKLVNACRYTIWAIDDTVVLASDVYTNLLKNILTSRTMIFTDKRTHILHVLGFIERKGVVVNPEILARAKKLAAGSQGNYAPTQYQRGRWAEGRSRPLKKG